MKKQYGEDFHEMESANILEGFQCLGMLCEIKDSNIPYRWWCFKKENTYIAAWDMGNGWWSSTYFEITTNNQEDAINRLAIEIIHELKENDKEVN